MFCRLFVASCSVFLLAPCVADDHSHPETAAEFVAAHPDRAARLFGSLDLDRPELDSVRGAISNGDLAVASERLLQHYRESSNGTWLRDRLGVHDPGGFDNNVIALANAVLRDQYLLQGVTGTVARLPSGGIDWHDNGPNDDFQWAIFVNRHFVLLALQKAYAETGKVEYIQYINRFLQDWIVNNYPADEGPSDKHLSANWRPMSSASRLLQVWPQLFYFLQDVDDFSPATRLMMLSSVPEQIEHLMRYHRRKHNHAIKEMSGLGHAAAAWPEFRDAAEWTDYSANIMEQEIRLQVYPSGVQKELASHYHRTVLEYVAQYAAFSEEAGVKLSPDFITLVQSMVDYLAWTMTPDGHVILNNDSDRDFVRQTIADWADAFDRDDWRFIAAFGKGGRSPGPVASRFFPWAGVLTSRNNWSADAHWAYFDIGPWGVSHQHNDKLHVSLSVGTRNFLVDTGRAYYIEDDPIRQHVIGTASHNTILVDGRGQGPRQLESEIPMKAAALTEPSFDIAVGTYDDGYEGLDGTAAHTRMLLYLRDRHWVILDRIATDRPREIEVLWHFHPETTPEIDNADITTRDVGLANLRIQPIGDINWQSDVVAGQLKPDVQGWYSPVYNTVLPAPTVRFRGEIDGTATFAWLLTSTVGDVPAIDTTVHGIGPSYISFSAFDDRYEFDLQDRARLVLNQRQIFPAAARP